MLTLLLLLLLLLQTVYTDMLGPLNRIPVITRY
jgi:hypothetical protein